MRSEQNYDKVLDVFGKVKDELINRKSVFGVGHGFKEVAGLLTEKPSIIVYVNEKLDEQDVSQEELIPKEFDGVPTDVVSLSHHRHGAQDEHDHGFLNYSKIHDENLNTMENQNPDTSSDVDEGNIAIIVDDPASSFIIPSRNAIDWAHAYNKFREKHPDIYDFVTFWAPDLGVDCECGAFYSPLENNVQGINWDRYWRGGPGRSGWNTNKLQAFHFFIRHDDFTLLQEMGHHWGALAGFNENETDTQVHYDHLLGNKPGHWDSYMDDDHSPMDYDDYSPAHGGERWVISGRSVDWTDNKDGTFTRHKVSPGQFVFCDLDLYLMGLIPPSKVKPFFYIKNPTGSFETISGEAKYVTIQNIIWANGERRPDSSSSQKTFKQAFVVLTKDADNVKAFARSLDPLRKRYNKIFYYATRYLAKVDTTLSDSTILPRITNVSWQRTNDEATINWKTNVSSKSIVNYSDNKEDLLENRFVEHTISYQSASNQNLNTEHQLKLTGLDSQKIYYFEVMAETKDGSLDRNSNDENLFILPGSTSPPEPPPPGPPPSEPPSPVKTRCFIATAAYGSELAPQVHFLREFRDNIILNSRFRRIFEESLNIYYKSSPPIADLMRQNKLFKYTMKYSVVWPFVALARTAAFLVNPFIIRKTKR